jgi:nicotinate-nucleotide pyrophosphorylase (carboxylating)
MSSVEILRPAPAPQPKPAHLPLLRIQYEGIVRTALEEDLGRAGDLTTDGVVSAHSRARAAIAARGPGVVAGLDVAALAFTMLDPDVRVAIDRPDGSPVQKGDRVALIEGPARAILTGERTALNFLCRLSGIASQTARMVEGVRGTKAHIICTRKTTPGLRTLEKYAVRVGGGMNHRFGLDDAMLIKDNHIAVAGGVAAALMAARAFAGHLVKVEIEVDGLDQLAEVLKTGGADVVLLDNMNVTTLKRAVELNAGKLALEASGGVSLETVAAIAETGVDMISVGALTHSAPALDLGLDVEI